MRGQTTSSFRRFLIKKIFQRDFFLAMSCCHVHNFFSLPTSLLELITPYPCPCPSDSYTNSKYLYRYHKIWSMGNINSNFFSLFFADDAKMDRHRHYYWTIKPFFPFAAHTFFANDFFYFLFDYFRFFLYFFVLFSSATIYFRLLRCLLERANWQKPGRRFNRNKTEIPLSLLVKLN